MPMKNNFSFEVQEVASVSQYPVRLYRRADVCAMLSIANSTLSDYVAKGIIAKPLKLNPQESAKHGSVAWLESDILAFVNSRQRAE